MAGESRATRSQPEQGQRFDPSAPVQHDTGAAIGYLLFGITSGLGLDLCGKWLLRDYPLVQFVMLRSVFGLVFLSLLIHRMLAWRELRTRRWGWHLLRTLLASGAMFGFFYGLSQLPLVQVLTLGFTAPLMMTALSRPLLGERVGWRRWLAVVFGFVGVLVVLRPGWGTETISLAALGVLGAAFFYACLAISARHLAGSESAHSLAVYVVVGPLVISLALLPGKWVQPDPTDWSLFALAGLCSACAWIGIVGGYRRASPSLLAPLEYSALIGGAAAGYWIWGEVPDRWVVIGALIIIASGLLVVYRDLGLVRSSRSMRVFTAGVAALFRRRP